MKEKLVNALFQLMKTKSYDQISIGMICDAVPTSRRTFYNYFDNKDHMIEWIVINDFMENALPVFRMKIGLPGVKAFFPYIKNNKNFYSDLLKIDNGYRLEHALMKSYDSYVEEFILCNTCKTNQHAKINKIVFKNYSSAAIANVVVEWIRNNMEDDIDELSRDLGIMIEYPLSFIRDKYLI